MYICVYAYMHRYADIYMHPSSWQSPWSPTFTASLGCSPSCVGELGRRSPPKLGEETSLKSKKKVTVGSRKFEYGSGMVLENSHIPTFWLPLYRNIYRKLSRLLWS